MAEEIWWERTLCQIEDIIGIKISESLSFDRISSNQIEEVKDVILNSHNNFKGNIPMDKEKIAFLEMFNTRDMSAWLSHKFAGGKNPYLPLPDIAASLHKYLLYYDSVAICEPLAISINEANAWASSLKLTTSEATRRLGNTVLQDGLRFWAKVRPLLNTELIKVFPSCHRYPLIRSEECNSLCELDDKNLEVLNQAEKIVLRSLPHQQAQMFRGFLSIAHGKDNLNRRFFNVSLLYAEQEGYELVPQSLFGAALYMAKGLTIGHTFTPERFQMKQNLTLTACQLPFVESLSSSEIINLHDDSKTFKVWRSQLSRILDQVELSNPDTFKRAVDNEIPELSYELQLKLSKYSLGSRLRKGGISFGAGALGAFSATGEPISSLIGGGVTSGATLLLSLIFERPSASDIAMQRVFQIISCSDMGNVPII